MAVTERSTDTGRRGAQGLGVERRAPAATAVLHCLIAQADGTGIDTSVGLLFNHTVWGRDRVITALDVLPELQEAAAATILALAGLQGVRSDRRSEEEPGRIHSEHRDLRAWQGPVYLRRLFGALLAPVWGGDADGYTTYFSSDSTPLYVILVDEYAKLDPAILDLAYARKDGQTATLRESVRAALCWIEGHITPSGLVEVPKHNPLSLPPQVWRDSPTSNFDADGRMPSFLEPIAWLDIQILCVEALRRGAWLLRAAAPLPEDGELPEATAEALAEAELLEEDAAQIRDATLRCFWIPEQRYFGCALDRDGDQRRRLLTAVQSNAGWMLATGFLDGLPENESREYVEGVVRMLFSADMLTDVGLRGRALAHHNLLFRNYHENIWPVDTFMIAKGLRRQGFDELAEQLELRLLNAMNALGSHYEFFVVDDDGRVVDPQRKAGSGDGAGRARSAALATEMVPDRDLAWSVTAAWRIKRDRAARARNGGRRGADAEEWVRRLTVEVMEGKPLLGASRSAAEARRAVRLSDRHLAHWLGLLFSAATVVRQGVPVLAKKYVNVGVRGPVAGHLRLTGAPSRPAGPACCPAPVCDDGGGPKGAPPAAAR